MTQLDETIFDEAGLGDLTKEEKKRMLGYVAQTLKTRIGIRLAKDANEEQLKKFDELAKAGDDEKTLDGLASIFPDFEKIAQEELKKVKADLKEVAPEVLAAR